MEKNFPEQFDYHGYQRELERTLEKINNGFWREDKKTKKKFFLKLNKSNKKNLIDYYEYLTNIGKSIPRIQKQLNHLLELGIWLNKPFRKVRKKDIEKLVFKIEKKQWHPHYKRDFKIALKLFYKWLHGLGKKDPYPKEVDWIDTSENNSGNKLPKEILTKEEVARIADATDSIRDRAFVTFLYYSGARIGEMLNLKIKDIEFNEHGAVVNITYGKTGSRRILVVEPVPDLANWLNIHPFKNDKNAFIWIGTKYNFRPIGYNTANFILAQAAKKAGIDKPVNPHAFRHARATYMAKFLTEAQMKAYFGWTQGSKMASIYVHLSGRDTDSAILRASGIEPSKEEKAEPKKWKFCLRCKERNDVSNHFCWRCGTPLDAVTPFDLQTAINIEDKKNEKEKLVAFVLEELNKRLNIKDEIKKIIEDNKLEDKMEL